MLDNRSLKLDLFALALLGLVAFLGLSVLTYSPADPPSDLVYPAVERCTNVCGQLGALAAHGLLTALGLGAYYLVASLAVLDVRLLARSSMTQPLARAIGWALSLAGLTTLASLALWNWSPGPVIGAGGYLGAAGRGFLEEHFASVGAYILTLSVTGAGLLLCTDYVLVRLVARALGLPVGVLQRSAGVVRRGEGRVRRRDAAGSDERGGGPAIRFPEKTIARVASKVAATAAPAAQAVLSAAIGEGEADEPVAESSETSSVGVARRLASALRIKVPGRGDREAVMQELDAAVTHSKSTDGYTLPTVDLLLPGETVCYDEHEKDVRRKAKILEKSFASFGFKVKVVEIETGPVIAQFEIELESGLRLSKITALADDLAIALRVPSVRIVAPIPGKNTVGIEVPNAERQIVRLREVIEEGGGSAAKMRIPIYLGKDVSGKPMVVDLSTLPHLLIAGRTGTGKSVCLNSIILSMVMSRRPDEVRMLLIDPKMVELSPYKSLPHLMHPVVTDMRKAEAILAWAVEKMEERYALLARAGVRHIGVYNQLGEEELMDRLEPESDEEREQIPLHLPYIVIVADEMADLMMTSAKEVEQHIIRLAQKSRAVGIHLVLATQKPTVDVITGLIKSNLPARIAFQVASRTDSRVVLDEMGADKLLGNGDMLFLWPGTSTLLRGQGTYVSDEEINRVIDFVGISEPNFVKELVQLKPAEALGGAQPKTDHRDELYNAAVDLVVREGRGSVSLLQRGLGIGYGRAARLIDYMAEDGIVGQYNGSQAREVIITAAQWADLQAQGPSDVTEGRLPSVRAERPARPPALSVPPTSRASSVRPPFDVDAEEEGYEQDEESSGDLDDDEADADDADSHDGNRFRRGRHSA